MKSCERYELLASLAIDGEASPEERAQLAEHLEACPDCRAYYEDLKRLHGGFAREEAVLPEGFSARVMDRVRETPQDRPEKKRVPFPRWGRWAALAACCGVVALSAWGVWENRKGDLVSTDSAPRDAAAQSMEDMPAAQDLEPVEDAAPAEDAVLENKGEEAPPPVSDEYATLAKSAAKDGEGEGSYQPLPEAAPEPVPAPAPAVAASPAAADAGEGEEADALLTSGGTEREQETDGSSGEEAGAGGQEDPDLPAEPPAQPEEDPAGADEKPKEGPEEDAGEVEPVSVLGVPEPGILIAYGGAAQDWVEDVLGLEWAAGGSYPLTAEQYGQLVQILDEAGEPYRIEPGEGYCLLTE